MTVLDPKINSIEWTNVDSSAVNRVAYDQIQRRIYVEFTRGAVYRYDDCDQSVYSDMMDAGSIGSYVHNHLRAHDNFEVTGS